MEGQAVETGMAHLTWTIGLIVALVGLWKGYSAWRASKNARLVQSMLRDELLTSVHKELHPNGGSSMADRVARIESAIEVNATMLARMEQRNEEFAKVHLDIQRRIDGMFEMMAGPSATEGRRIRGHRSHRVPGTAPQSDEEGTQ